MVGVVHFILAVKVNPFGGVYTRHGIFDNWKAATAIFQTLTRRRQRTPTYCAVHSANGV